MYAVGPAHVMFCDTANRVYMSEDCDVAKIRREVEADPPSHAIEIAVGGKVLQPTRAPLIGYRYEYKDEFDDESVQESDELDHQLCMNDIALFPFDMSEAQGVQRELEDLKLWHRLEQLESVSSVKDFVRYCNKQPIAVKGFTGELVEYFSIQELLNRCFGIHFTFRLTSSQNNQSIE